MGGDPDTTVEDTPERKELAKISYEKYGYFERDLLPVRDEWLSELMSANDEQQHARLENKVSVGNAAVFNEQQRSAERALKSSGVNPNSGAFQVSLAELSEAQSSIDADVKSRAHSTQQDNYMKGVSSAIALGEKKSAQAIDGLNTVANQAQRSARDKAQSQAQNTAMITNSASSLAGFAYSANENSKGGD